MYPAKCNKAPCIPRSSSATLLDLLADMDRVLASDEHFLLGAWIESAKRAATTADERVLYEYNARVQVTMWGPSEEVSFLVWRGTCSYIRCCRKFVVIWISNV